MSSLQTPPGKADKTLARIMRILAPIAVLAISIAIWSFVVRINNIRPYVLPGPEAVFKTLIDDWQVLSSSLLVTLWTTLEGFVAAAIGGIALADRKSVV